jgi:cobalamin biosynthesis Co2+ chelatase CbiK
VMSIVDQTINRFVYTYDMIEFLVVAVLFYFIGRFSVTKQDSEWLIEQIKKRKPKENNLGAVDFMTHGQIEDENNETPEVKTMRSLFKNLKIKPKRDIID